MSAIKFDVRMQHRTHLYNCNWKHIECAYNLIIQNVCACVCVCLVSKLESDTVMYTIRYQTVRTMRRDNFKNSLDLST